MDSSLVALATHLKQVAETELESTLTICELQQLQTISLNPFGVLYVFLLILKGWKNWGNLLLECLLVHLLDDQTLLVLLDLDKVAQHSPARLLGRPFIC